MDNPKFDEETIANELEKIKELIKKVEIRFSKLSGRKSKKDHEEIYVDMMCILVYLGRLSGSDDMKEVRDMYEAVSREEYPQSPKKAMKLFLKNYTKHTERFDVLKERCWKTIEKTIPVVFGKGF